MDFLYFYVKAAPIFNDKIKACQQYFINEGGFTNALILALCIAAIFAIIYYVVAHVSFKWPSLTTWIVSMVVCGGVCFFATGIQTGIHAKGGAFPKTVEKEFKKRTSDLTPEERAPLEQAKTKLQHEFKKSYFGSSPVNRLCWTNFVISIVLFYIFSIVINGLSRHGGNTPHAGLLTKRK